MTLTRQELLSIVLGYAVWLFILTYFLVYQPVQRLIWSVKNEFEK